MLTTGSAQVIGLTDGAGAVKASYAYDAWGNTRGGSRAPRDGGPPLPPAARLARERPLLLRARYYDPPPGNSSPEIRSGSRAG